MPRAGICFKHETKNSWPGWAVRVGSKGALGSAGDGRDREAEVGLVVDEGDLQRARYLLVSGSSAGLPGAFAESTEGLFALGGEAQVQLPERGAEARGVAEGNLEVDADGGVGEEVEVRDPAEIGRAS